MHKATIIGGVKMYPPSHRDNELALKNIIVYEEGINADNDTEQAAPELKPMD